MSIGFDRLLDADSTPAADAFALSGTTSTLSDAAIDGRVLTLTITPAVTHENVITVGYTKPSASPLKRAGQAIFVDTFLGQAVSNGTVDPTPIFQSASVDASGRSLTIVMSNPLLGTAAGVPALAAFSVGGTTNSTVDSVALDGSSILLSLSPPADLNESVEISYVPPVDQLAPTLQSADGHWRSPAWTSESVTNHADGVPRLVGGVANGDSIALEFDRNLDDSLMPEPGAFSVTPNHLTVSNVEVKGRTVTLNLSGPVGHDDEVTVSYSATGMPLLTREGHTLTVEAFTGASVTNETPRPLVLSAVGNGRTIVVSFSVSLDEAKTPGVDAFSLAPGELEVGGVSVLATTVTLTLDDPLSEGVEYILSYAATDSMPLTNEDGEELPVFSEALINNTDTAPVATSATGDGLMVTIAFDQSLDAQSEIPNSSFTLSADEAVAVANVAHGDRALLLTLSRPLKEDESATVTYTAPDEDGIADSTGHRSASFSLTVVNQTDTAPAPVTGTVEDDTIIIILDQELVQDVRFGSNEVCPYEREADDDEDKPSYPIEHFTLTETDAMISFVCVSHNGPGGDGRIEIRLAQKVMEGEGISINYFPMSGSIRIEDNDAGENRAQINNYELQNLTDEPPVPESATVNAETVTVTFDQALDPDSVPAASAFSLTPDGPSVILASIQGAVLILTLAESVVEDVTYTLSYTPTEGGKLLDKTGNSAEAFELLEMFENTTDYAPLPIKVKTDDVGSKLTIEFDQRLDPSNTIDHSWFSLEPAHPVDFVEFDPESVDQRRLIVRLEPGSEIREGESVSLVYSPSSSGGLQDDDAPNAVLAFTIAVLNAVDVAPAFEGATVNRHVLESRV